MLSLEHCGKQLEKYGKKYTDQQIEEIRKKLHLFADIQINHSKTSKNDDLKETEFIQPTLSVTEPLPQALNAE